MVYDETMYKLRQLKLSGFVEALAMQSEDDGYHEMSFEQRLAILVDHEFAKRQSKSLERLVKNARFHNHQASLTEINYREDRKLDRNIILELGACNYIRHSQNVVILGATGAGKSFLAQGLGQAACQHRLSTRYTTLTDFLEEVNIAKSRGIEHLQRLRKLYTNFQLLIFDDWLLFRIEEEDVATLLQVIDGRRFRGSTIVVSQLNPTEWIDQMPTMTAAEALTDRLTAGARRIIIHGEKSMRLG